MGKGEKEGRRKRKGKRTREVNKRGVKIVKGYRKRKGDEKGKRRGVKRAALEIPYDSHFYHGH